MKLSKLAIFDFDGTLADSFPFFLRVFDQLREMMSHVGLPAWKLPMVAKDFIGLMRAHRGSVPMFEGVAELLLELRARDVVLGIVSSNS